MGRMVKKSMDNNNNNNNYNQSETEKMKYKGVRKRKWGKWVSEIRLPNSRERIWLGSYDSPEKAARAFDAAQFCLRGKSANYNFPNNPPEIAGGRSMTPEEIQVAAARFANMAVGDEMMVVDDRLVRDESEENYLTVEEYSLCYSPSISDGTTSFEMTGVDSSFQEQLSLSTTLGSGNYASEFGFFPGFDDFTAGEFFCTPQQTPHNFEYGALDDTYDASLYQNSYLWNF